MLSEQPDENALRLLEGLAAAIAEKGYAATTIADIVRHAHVSKRTFYQHFADKEACFLASYRAVTERLMTTIAAAVDPNTPWQEQLHAAARAYLHLLEENPALTRTFLVEIHAAGPKALELRREVHQRFAELLRGLVNLGRKKHPEIRPLSASMATALVGGINELVLVAVEGGGRLRELERTATELLTSVLLSSRS